MKNKALYASHKEATTFQCMAYVSQQSSSVCFNFSWFLHLNSCNNKARLATNSSSNPKDCANYCGSLKNFRAKFPVFVVPWPWRTWSTLTPKLAKSCCCTELFCTLYFSENVIIILHIELGAIHFLHLDYIKIFSNLYPGRNSI